jgi:stage II sporulation protein D
MFDWKECPKVTVGIMDRQTEVAGCLNGQFHAEGLGPVSGLFSGKAEAGMIVLADESHREIGRSPLIRIKFEKGLNPPIRQGTKEVAGQTFTLFHVTIGNCFHWERTEDQVFKGDLILCAREDGTITVINEIPVEDYLTSVISSEMNASAPIEFLKAHAILSRSWLLSALSRKNKIKETSVSTRKIIEREGEVIRWYDWEDHDLFDVCADDHCQRYQGMMKIASEQPEEAVQQTHGMVIAYEDEICDARYSKVCGGITEDFKTAWDDKPVPYLKSICDASAPHLLIQTEEEASQWILSFPEAYCQTKDEHLLERILSNADHETKDFFRWRVDYSRTELEEILREKSGFDLGTLKELLPLSRGPSGRIYRLKIVGSKRSVLVGKELEIRRWLSRSHLYSSAFVVAVDYNPDGEVDRFIFHGAGWGHGVGLCQIGAAVMATSGFSADQILKHYFRGVNIQKIY